MQVVVFGATGFIGRSLVRSLLRDGHQVVAASRRPQEARNELGAEATVESVDEALARVGRRVDAVINLAGSPVLEGRWTETRKKKLTRSRVNLTTQLVEAMEAAPPAVFVNASAVGIYGETGDRVTTEDSAAGSGFLAELCVGWERAALEAERLGTRVVLLRTGIVLGAEGGALERMVPLFRSGLGGRIGSGRQWVPWISLRDAVSIILRALSDERIRGPLNLVSPNPVTNSVLTEALGRTLRRATWLPAPASLLEAALGEASTALLQSSRVVPGRLEALGFEFEDTSLEGALADIFAAADGPRFMSASEAIDAQESLESIETAAARHALVQEVLLDAPLDSVWSFFSQASNLGSLTPPWASFRFEGQPPASIERGSIIDYRIGLGPLPLSWRTEIVRWQAGESFVDLQVRGPYRLWWHEHRFWREGNRTRMRDRVLYTLPLGPLGVVAHNVAVRSTLRRIFRYRTQAMRERFGLVPSTAPDAGLR